MNSSTLLISCPDQKGIVSQVSTFLFEHNANIVSSEQHQDLDENLFLMRIEWDKKDFKLNDEEFKNQFSLIGKKLQMNWSISHSNEVKKVILMVSKQDHCLVDLLHRNSKKELNCEIIAVISNHKDSEKIVSYYKVPFIHVPILDSKKEESMNILFSVIKNLNPDLIILARYMQVLSPLIVNHYINKIINIHHSFLPAFIGANPYKQAFNRGVKIVGATSHYVTEVLDDGPIIEQDVVRTSHHESVKTLIEKGADLERIVLFRAVKWHLENRILTYKNKTVVFK